MAQLDTLPPDQRAALQLLLKQGQSYEQLGGLLKIDADAVRRRAYAALDALGPETEASDEDRAHVADYLLGQQTVSQRESTRVMLADSPAARDWARDVARSLRPLAGDGLPEVPGGEREGVVAVRGRVRTPEPDLEEEDGDEAPYTRPRAPRRAERDRHADRERAPYERGEPGGPSSRLGGALLLAGLGIVVAVALILLINGGGDDDDNGGGTRPARTTPPTQTGGPSRPIAQINLFSPAGGSRTVGLAQVFQMGNRRAIIVAGQGVQPGTYALWLFNSPTQARFLGFVPQRVGRDGRFATQGELPGDAASFRRLVVTRENVTRNTRRPPARPGPIALQGDFRLN